MAKVPGFAKAFAGRWRIAQIDERGSHEKDTTRMTPLRSRIRLRFRTRLSSSTAC